MNDAEWPDKNSFDEWKVRLDVLQKWKYIPVIRRDLMLHWVWY